MSQKNIISCPICSGTSLQTKSKVKDHSISKEIFELTECQNCGFLFTNPQPSGEQLWKYYESENYVSHSKTSKGFINYWYKQLQGLNLKLKFDVVKKYVPRGTWIDYGAGAGDFVKYVKQHKIEVIGLEPNEKARKTAREQNVDLLEPDSIDNIKAGSISCITLWHVLEHIPDFSEVLTQLSALLKENGILVLALPNYKSRDAQKYQEDWAAFDVPRHLWHFTEKDIRNLADQKDLNLIHIQGMVFDSFYVSLLSEKYIGGSKLSGIRSGLLSNLSAAKKSSPYSSQIYILRK